MLARGKIISDTPIPGCKIQRFNRYFIITVRLPILICKWGWHQNLLGTEETQS